MRAERGQSDDELAGDLGPGQLSRQQTQDFQLALAERLQGGRRRGGGGAGRSVGGRLRFKGGQQLAGKSGQAAPGGGSAQ
jgi:hypothetical protein